MITKNILSLLFSSMFLMTAFAQPSESELKSKVRTYYNNSNLITSIEFGKSSLEKRWTNNSWRYYWSRNHTTKMKTEYPGVYQIHYGGVQYTKNGSSYSYSNMLVGGLLGYEGIPNPSVGEINAHLKETFAPLDFYPNYQMNYLIDAPNTVHLADDPNWKWIGLNEVMCDVVSTYTVLTNDIGDVEKRQGTFRITLNRSADGITFVEDAKLLKTGKWLPILKGREQNNPKVLESYTLTREEKASTRTFAQQYAERHAEEFKKSLQVVEMPEFDNANHLLQFIHELLIEGDEDKVTAFCYMMFQPNLFEEWSEIVLNQNGKSKLDAVLEELPNYKKAYCKHPIIKEISGTTARFYDRNKKRINTLSVGWENNRWYVYEMKYIIRDEDFAGFEANQEDNCGDNPIYLDVAPQFNVGDKVEIFHGGSWRDAEILKAEMNKGGYSVKYGVSGLTEWKYVSEVRPSNAPAEEAVAFKEFEIGEKVQAKYTNVWYDGTILKVSYDAGEYLVSIPERNIDAWIHNQEIVGAKESTSSNNSNEEVKNDAESGKKIKKGLGGLKNKIKVKIP